MPFQIQLYPKDGLRGFGKLGLEGAGSTADSVVIFNKIITTTIGILTIVAVLIFIFQLLTGAIGMITSGGDKNKLSESRNRIFVGLIGLVIVIAATFIVDIVGTILGINFLEGAWFIPLLKP